MGRLQLFQGVAAEHAAALIAACPVVRLAPGEWIPEQDDGRARLYIVLRGALDVTHPDARIGVEGASTRVLPGECVGELSVLDEEADLDCITALQETDLLVVDAQTLWRLVDESNGVARNLLRLLSFRIRTANAQLRRRQKVGEFYRQLSLADGLTGLQNRAWMNEQLPVLVDNAHATGSPLSVIMIDIDHFKRFNDEHGHVSGDHALQVAARTIAAALRPTDFAARFGGEEMLVILPGTGAKAAMHVAERLFEQLRQAVVFQDMRKCLPHITASFGLAMLAVGQDAEGLLSCADAALYRAKQNGRDRVAA